MPLCQTILMGTQGLRSTRYNHWIGASITDHPNGLIGAWAVCLAGHALAMAWAEHGLAWSWAGLEARMSLVLCWPGPLAGLGTGLSMGWELAGLSWSGHCSAVLRWVLAGLGLLLAWVGLGLAGLGIA